MHLSRSKIRRNYLIAALLSLLVALGFVYVIWDLQDVQPGTFGLLLAMGGLLCGNLFWIFTRKHRDRKRLSQTPFPEAWRQLLEEYVAFYRALSPEEKRRFETEIQIFLHETRITGIKTEVDDRTMLLAAAGAEIPVFRFPEWEYPNLGEILIYPDSFTTYFRTEGPGRNVQGMVGTGIMQGVMILSKPALIQGFKNPKDRHNVAIHEFAHLLDAADGDYDGIPKLFLEQPYLAPWLELMGREKERIRKGKSRMNPYALTSPVEFFAVAAEYFFEDPERMKREKPELYDLMMRIFRQDTQALLVDTLRDLVNYTGKKIGRNAPCPCLSGKKYKDCCLRQARQL